MVFEIVFSVPRFERQSQIQIFSHRFDFNEKLFMFNFQVNDCKLFRISLFDQMLVEMFEKIDELQQF